MPQSIVFILQLRPALFLISCLIFWSDLIHYGLEAPEIALANVGLSALESTLAVVATVIVSFG